MDAFTLRDGALEVEFRRAVDYVPGSAPREIGSAYGDWQATAVDVRVDGRPAASAVLLAREGFSAVDRERVVLRGGTPYAAVEDGVFALDLPALDVLWAERMGYGSVFRLMEIGGEDALLVHGELDITRLGMDGRIRWQRGGADIFTGGCHIEDGVVVAVDWNGHVYRWRLSDGEVI
jgi:outer membrane protein assembly factor BamB